MQGLSELMKHKNNCAVLDGGLGTELKAMGANTTCELWSAHFIKEDPDLIRRAHRAFYESGSDIVITSSYQSSVDLFMKVFELKT